jgi:hypothetical protein
VVGGSEAKKVTGSDIFCSIFVEMVFSSSFLTRNAQKREKKNERKSALDFRRFFCKSIAVVFLNSPCRETPKKEPPHGQQPIKWITTANTMSWATNQRLCKGQGKELVVVFVGLAKARGPEWNKYRRS